MRIAALALSSALTVLLSPHLAKPSSPASAYQTAAAPELAETPGPESPPPQPPPTTAPEPARSPVRSSLLSRVSQLLARTQLQVGTRTSYFSFAHDTGNFLGSIDRLDAQQDYWPPGWLVGWALWRGLRCELAWDRVRTRTITTSDGHSDGTIVLEGPTISLSYGWPVRDRKTPSRSLLRPYAGLGLTHFFGRFDHEGWWHYGFLAERWQDAAAAYEAWRITGVPENPNGGYRRNMHIDDTIGLAGTAGCDVRLAGHLRLDVLARYIRVKTNVTYVQSTAGVERRTKSSTFDMSSHALSLGLRYAF